MPVATRYFHPRFVSIPSHAPASPEAEAIVHGEITEVIRDSVAKHMRADVTVGAFLSGGIDSTAIAALAKEHNPDLITFTTGFEREGYSEVDVAAESAAAIGVKHVVRTVKPDEMMEALPLIVWYLDDPVADPALVPLWFIAREARQHVKVVLSGEGADELFGGYTIYREPISLAPFEKVPGALRPLLGRASRRLPEGMRGKDLLRRGSLDLEERYYGNARIFRDDQLHSILRQYDPRVSHTDVTARHYAESEKWDPVARMQHVDLFTWLRGDILVKADKMTMANSLELRVPFLDPEDRLGPADGAEDHRWVQRDHEVRAARGAGLDRPRARAEPAQARLPRPDPTLAAGRDVLLGAGRHPGLRRGPPRGPARRAGDARRPPRGPRRPLPPDLDAPGLPDLVRDLRGAPDHRRRPRAHLPCPDLRAGPEDPHHGSMMRSSGPQNRIMVP
jgi:asparagine synthetase B (glutamine-hydrolysing)